MSWCGAPDMSFLRRHRRRQGVGAVGGAWAMALQGQSFLRRHRRRQGVGAVGGAWAMALQGHRIGTARGMDEATNLAGFPADA
nr:hypothetical protein GCM10020063_109650 [Dactylosporangium thailandense]